jgi:hypothetical protein
LGAAISTPNIGLILIYKERELKMVDVKFQVEVGYQASSNYFYDYKIYGTTIKMFIPKNLKKLWQPP